MKLDKFKFTNFRRVSLIESTLHERLTVFIARNGEGKTTILDALSILLSSYSGAFDHGKAKGIEHSDVRFQRLPDTPDNEPVYPCVLNATLSIQQDDPTDIKRELTGAKNKTTNRDISVLTAHGKNSMSGISNLKEEDVSIVAYYGTGRLWSVHKDNKNRKTISASRSVAFEDCLSSSSNYKQMQDWVKNAAMAVLQQQQMPDAYKGYSVKDQLAGIANAVEEILKPQGWSQFHFSVIHQELAMLHEEQGILPVSMLSDGVRAMISLVADLAWRCAKLNPHLKDQAPQQTSGIVLIDEVDMHLHPEWQQRVMGSLLEAFPNIQFIVTTHSPQVLSTVERQSIRELVEEELDDDSKVVTGRIPPKQSRGVASNDLLAELQYTNPTPDVPEAKWLSEYKALIVQGAQESPEGKRLKQKLLGHFGDQHPEWSEIQRLVRLQAIKAKIPRTNQ